jgi:dTDP-4-amino-4,6-dideoxygalactose transaminase
MHTQKCFANGKSSYPNAERFCEETIALPGLNFTKPMDIL